MNDAPKTLVIIVTWNKKRYLLDLLDSLSSLDYPRRSLDILVVDNASSDGTVEALAGRKDITLLRNRENLGGTGGFNTGLAWAFAQPEGRYDFLWLLDNDVQVHRNALTALVALLRDNPDLAIAGSTMMQLDYPWRINEMGASFDRRRGVLKLHRHMEEIAAWKSLPLERLRTLDIDLGRHLPGCPKWRKVDYVAAASLLIRSEVARQAGLWDDFFIHFDDVEWCLRIARLGHGVAVSADSLIWHLSALSKVPSWILYYDNRNVLYLLEKHGEPGSVARTRRWIKLKALYYAVLGKQDLSRLHCRALQDFRKRVKGKSAIELDPVYRPLGELETLLSRPEIRKILIPWTVPTEGLDLPALLSRPGLTVDLLLSPDGTEAAWMNEVPGASKKRPPNRLRRWRAWLRRQPPYDLVLQSDYRPVPALSRLGRQVLFLNNESLSLRERPRLSSLIQALWTVALS